MILFMLKCAAAHEFEGWFRDNAACERQQARHQIACPVCGDTAVEKAPMAPRLAKSRHTSARSTVLRPSYGHSARREKTDRP